MKNITILVASVEKNMALAEILQTQLTSLNIDSQIIDLVALDLVMYHSIEESKGIPSSVSKLIETLNSSQGYIVVAPEYNYSIPPILTNAIAWISRVGDDFKACFTAVPILLATHSGGGGTDVLRDMRNQFSKLGAEVYAQEILTTYKKPLETTFSMQVLEEFTQS